jgi:hypothetical protein
VRVDDAQHITDAIRMIKGVADAVPIVASVESHWALEAARRELRDELWQVLYPKLS